MIFKRALLLGCIGIVIATSASCTSAAKRDPESCGSTSPSNHRASVVACAATTADASPRTAGDACLTDQDCGATGVCSCSGNTFGGGHSTANACVMSNCRVDADCGPRGICSPSVDFATGPFYGVRGYYCHTPDDTCGNDADCCAAPAGEHPFYCGYSPEVGHWACANNYQAG